MQRCLSGLCGGVSVAFVGMAGIWSAAPALADETWTNPAGIAIYEEEIAGTAVFSIPMQGDRARLYLEGLAGNYDNRSKSHGYWIGPDKPICGAKFIAPDGLQSSNWGRVTIVFDGPSFPTGWTATLGTCFGRKTTKFRADLE